MKLADSSHQRLEAFFREYFGDSDFRLPVVELYVGGFTKILTNLISVHGITFGKRIFIAPRLLSVNQKKFLKLPEDLVAHEIVHVLQYRRDGFVKFFNIYLSSFWRNLRRKKSWDSEARQKAYLEIPYEIEARRVAARFVEWNRRSDEELKNMIENLEEKTDE